LLLFLSSYEVGLRNVSAWKHFSVCVFLSPWLFWPKVLERLKILLELTTSSPDLFDYYATCTPWPRSFPRSSRAGAGPDSHFCPLVGVVRYGSECMQRPVLQFDSLAFRSLPRCYLFFIIILVVVRDIPVCFAHAATTHLRRNIPLS